MKWETVFNDWKCAEEEIWRPHFTERGFESWQEWRQTYIDELGLERREWYEIIIENPHAVIPGYAIGGYRGWHKYRPEGKELSLFSDIAKLVKAEEQSYEGGERVDVRTNNKIRSLLGNVGDTIIIAMRCVNLAAVLEGTHRCAAIAVEAHDKGPYSSGVFRMRYADFNEQEMNFLKEFCRDCHNKQHGLRHDRQE